jgi:hypothetical protein
MKKIRIIYRYRGLASKCRDKQEIDDTRENRIMLCESENRVEFIKLSELITLAWIG